MNRYLQTTAWAGAVVVAACAFAAIRASFAPMPLPFMDPVVHDVGQLTVGQERVVTVALVNPGRRRCRLRSATGICQGNVCVWQDGGASDVDLRPGATPFPVRVVPKYPGPFDLTWDVYADAGAQLVVIPIRLVGLVVAD